MSSLMAFLKCVLVGQGELYHNRFLRLNEEKYLMVLPVIETLAADI